MPKKRCRTTTWQPIDWASTPRQISIHMRAGDWMCSNCGTHNYARHQTCRSCSRPCQTRCGFDKEEKIRTAKEVRPGDWQCTVCGEVCFASKRSCYHCQTKRQSEHTIIPITIDEFKHGDWLCSMCGFHNFKDRQRCFMCHKK